MANIVIVLVLSCAAVGHGVHIQSRILNGIESKPSEFPFFAFINTPISNCGGTFISDRFVLTAAHCLRANGTTEIYPSFGGADNFGQVILVQPSNRYPHPNFSYGSLENDIALLKLPYRVKFSGNIQAAKLPNDCRPMNNGNIAAIAIGAGRYTVQNSEINSKYKLRHIQVTTMPTNACLPVLQYPNADEKFICANVPSQQSIYKGDSGGPLIDANDSTLIGVTAFVSQNDDENILDPLDRFREQGFTNVRYYFEWIASMTGLNLPKC